MSRLSLRLPDSLHEQVKILAKNDGISINQFISSAVAETMSALMTEEYLREKAGLGSESAFQKAMRKVPGSPPDEGDEL